MHHFLNSILQLKRDKAPDVLPGFATRKPQNISRDDVLKEYIKNLDKNSDKKKPNPLLYKPAKIYTGKREWFIFFYSRAALTDKFKRYKITGDINRIKDVDTRLLAAKILQRTFNEALQNGWLPAPNAESEGNACVTDYLNVAAALQDALRTKTASLRPRTAGTYKSHLKLFIAWLKKEKFHTLDINKITPVIIQKYQDHLLQKRQNHVTVNHKIEILSTLFSKLRKLQIVKENPCNAIDRLPQIESDYYEPITDEEITIIAKHLKAVKPELFIYILFIYYSLLRPETIVQLKGEHLSFAEKRIYIGGAMHKNKKKWIKQMLQPLYNYLIEFGYDKIAKDHYLFSTKLLPGKKIIKPERAREFWNKHVVDELKINKKMYALKHTSGINYLTDNLGREDIAWLKMQMAHSSLQETDTYVRKNSVKFLDETKATIRKI